MVIMEGEAPAEPFPVKGLDAFFGSNRYFRSFGGSGQLLKFFKTGIDFFANALYHFINKQYILYLN